RAILFDLDGTLVDTVGRRIDAWLAAFSEIGVGADAKLVAGLIGADGKRLAREVAADAGARLTEDDVAAIDRRAGDIFSELNAEPIPLPGARDLLLALAGGPLAVVVATSSLGAQVTGSVDALSLPERPTIVDGEHVQHAKPAPDLLLLAAERAGVSPDACWYVGDATWDFLACVAAGMTGIAVPTGAVDARALVDAGASLSIDGLDDLTVELRRRGLASDSG
ncbi:MAG: HAD family phosphatase, partial [Candidatus Limnocylindrales bacterium]